MDTCVGFIGCTKILICRPGGGNLYARSMYNGQKRFDCPIYRKVTAVDGLIFHIYGSEVSRRHDVTLYHQSGMEEILESCSFLDDRQFYLYGDPDYIIRPWR